MLFSIAIITAVLLDQLFGDPRWFPHPIKTIGFFCERLEYLNRRFITNKRVAGGISVLEVVGITIVFTFIVIKVAFFVSPILGYAVSIVILYTTIAAKDLAKHSRRVFSYLHPENDLENARKSVAMIVGRDTASLNDEGVSKACVETVAENMVDGVTAPLFYGIIAGFFSFWGVEQIGLAAIGGMTYKSINTMDSMFGYKNEKYILFGSVAARLDDVVNFIPARLTGLILIPTAFLLRLDWKNTWKTYMQDRLAHASPNAGHSEAAVAGALGIQLGGDSSYFGEIVSKPTMGKSSRSISPHDILVANRMMFIGSFIFVLLLLLIKNILGIFWL